MLTTMCCGSSRTDSIMQIQQQSVYPRVVQEHVIVDEEAHRPKLEGQLLKYTNVMKGWQSRWFVLTPDSGMLHYFETAFITVSQEDPHTFTVSSDVGEVFRLRASDAGERQVWVDKLQETARRVSLQSGNEKPAKDKTHKRVHYDSQVICTTCSTGAGTAKTCSSSLMEAWQSLIEAKTCASKLNGKISTLPFHGKNCLMTALDPDLLKLKATSAAAISGLDQCLSTLRSGRLSCPRQRLVHAESSVDARVASRQGYDVTVSATPSDQDREADPVIDCPGSDLTSPQLSSSIDGWDMICFPHDEEEEDEDETETEQPEEQEGTEEHKSVILHILSQLRIGMDLTKVVLPTFVLERRSLLELYADSMAHPDLFLRIPEADSPEDRMMVLLEWYLTSFHASRRASSTARKPYNPIIGETFHCSWLVPLTAGEHPTAMGSASGERTPTGGRPPAGKGPPAAGRFSTGGWTLTGEEELISGRKDSTCEGFSSGRHGTTGDELATGRKDYTGEGPTAGRKNSAGQGLATGRKNSTSGGLVTGRRNSAGQQLTTDRRNSAGQNLPTGKKKCTGGVLSTGRKDSTGGGITTSRETSTGERHTTGGEPPTRTPSAQGKALRLVFSAEQVSHHPPVSAFYLECREKKVCVNASLWTKSKFMGLSVGAVFVGTVKVYLLDHDEVYEFGLPTAYARSILSVPWVELGDRVTVTCEKTHLSADLTFHTKPFYGGQLHRVSGELKHTGTGHTLCRIAGQWNTSFEFCFADGSRKELDSRQLKVFPKRVRPISRQSQRESRRLWQHVTDALKAGDVRTATELKGVLEESQREGERHRKQMGIPYPTKYFHKEGDTWVFNHMLTSNDASSHQ